MCDGSIFKVLGFAMQSSSTGFEIDKNLTFIHFFFQFFFNFFAQPCMGLWFVVKFIWCTCFSHITALPYQISVRFVPDAYSMPEYNNCPVT